MQFPIISSMRGTHRQTSRRLQRAILIAVCAISLAPGVLHAGQSERIETVAGGARPLPSTDREIKTQFNKIGGVAKLLRQSVEASFVGAQQWFYYSQVADIAAVAEAGRDIPVYLLYETVTIPGGKREVLIEVSPHPFPKFLKATSAQYHQKIQAVRGTGYYLAMGMPKYAHFVKRLPGPQEPVPSQEERSAKWRQWRTYKHEGQWDFYKRKLQSWRALSKIRDKMHEEIGRPQMPLYVRNLDGSVDLVGPPNSIEQAVIKQRVQELATQMHRLEDQLYDLEVRIAGSAVYAEEYQVLRSQIVNLRAVVQYLQRLTETSPWMGSDFEYLVNLESLVYYTKRQAEFGAKRLEKIKRSAWTYIKNTVKVACENPDRLLALEGEGQLVGVRLKTWELQRFFLDEITTRKDLVGYLSGEAYVTLNACQQDVIKGMLHQRGPVTMSWLVDRARVYRVNHPSLLKRLGMKLDEYSDAFEDFLDTLPAKVQAQVDKVNNDGATRYDDDWFDEDDSSESGGIRSHKMGTINLNKPVWDGGTLGH